MSINILIHIRYMCIFIYLINKKKEDFIKKKSELNFKRIK